MEQNLLDLSFDNPKFSSSQKQVLQGLNEIIAAAEKIEATKINVGGDASYSLLNQKLAEQAKQIEALKNANVAYVQSQMQVTDATKATVIAITASNSELQTNIALRQKLQAQNKSYLTDQKEDLALLKNNIITRAEYNQRITDSSIKIEANRVKISDLSKTIKQQTQDNVNSIDAINRKNKAADAERKIQNELTSEYKQAVLAYNALQIRAKDYYFQLGAGHPLTVQAAKDADALYTKIKEADASVGQSNKNVGNYANGITQAAGKAFSAVRTIANVLPGLGLSGVFLLAYETLETLGKGFVNFAPKVSDVVKNYQNLKDVVKEANRQGAEETGVLKTLYKAATDVNLAAVDRNKAADELQRRYPTTFANLSNENILLGNAKTQYDELTTAILKNARAKAAQAKIDELEAQKFDAEAQRLKIVYAAVNERSRARDQFSAGSGAGDASRTITKDEFVRAINARRDAAVKAQNDIIRSAETQQQFLINLVGQGSLIDAIVPDPNKVKDRVDKVNDYTNELLKAEADRLKALAEMSKLQLELLAKTEKAISDDESNSLNIRLLALQSYAQTKSQIVANDQKLEITTLQNKLAEIANIEMIGASKRTEEQKKLLIEKDALQAQLQLAEFKGSIAIQAIQVETIERTRELRRKEAERIDKEEAQKVKTLQETAKAEIEARRRVSADVESQKKTDAIRDELAALELLNEEYAKGTLTVKEYNEKKAELSQKSTVAMLLAEKDALTEEYKLRRNAGDNTTKLREQLAAKDLAIEKALSANIINNDKETNKERIKLIDDIVMYENEAAKLLIGLSNAAFQDELNRITELKDAQDDYYSKQAENIRNSTLSEQDKANKLAILKNQQETSDRAFDKRKRDAQNKQAEFEKKITLFQITLNTAAAVVKALIDPGGIVGVGLSIAAGVKGAIEFAIAAATPVPKYAKGTPPGGHPGGLARYGEAGPEEVHEPGKSPYIVDTDTTGYLPARTIVKPLTKDYINSKARDGATRLTGRMGERRQERNEAWDIAKWQRGEHKKDMIMLMKRPVKSTVIVKGRLDVNKVFGR